MSKPVIGLLHSVIRPEEKLLMKALDAAPEVEWRSLDDRNLFLDPARPSAELSGLAAVMARSVSSSRGLYVRRILEGSGVRCFNTGAVAATCQDKLETSLALQRAGVAQPELRVAFSEDSAMEAIESMGYPVVLKPLVGSWGRLIARADDADAAVSLLEHKAALPNPMHQVFYLQQYIEKKGRDIRSFVVGDKLVAAILRKSADWRTNTARGATVEALALTPELEQASVAAANAVGGGMLAVDLFESDSGYLVNEVNDTMEFRNSIGPTGVDIPKMMVRHVIEGLAEAQAA